MHIYEQIKNQAETILSELRASGLNLSITDKSTLRIVGTATVRQLEIVCVWRQHIIESLSPKCSNCALPMQIINNGECWFCPFGCESQKDIPKAGLTIKNGSQAKQNMTNTTKTGTKHTFATFATALPSVYQKKNVSENNGELAKFEADTLHEVLNKFISAGVSFDVSADDFQAIDRANTLKASDREFLKLNGAVILCQLQQSLLVKHLFNHSPEQFEDFAFEIAERESLNTPLRITDKTRYEIYFQALRLSTRRWFAELLEKGEG